MSPPVDSLRAYMPMVAYPLRAMRVTSPFGIRKDPMDRRKKRMHSGLDLRARYENVYSMLPGRVIAVSYSENGGYYVSIDHGICVCSYLHLSKVMVRKRQRINAGQLIAISGNSGRRTTGPHLHISCRWTNGKYFDPMLILKFVTEQLSNNK
ncbi:M23 family metallopeptidase [uncultured Prevotella sp.]|uniref:M23 family metallopeptidase n=1 Tax=uncultured Prevotella sp. TaxID=159272 RepID=UPI00266E9746|nr:M23 family metallopeptidase [uncultured Prevotella sp.]